MPTSSQPLLCNGGTISAGLVQLRIGLWPALFNYKVQPLLCNGCTISAGWYNCASAFGRRLLLYSRGREMPIWYNHCSAMIVPYPLKKRKAGKHCCFPARMNLLQAAIVNANCARGFCGNILIVRNHQNGVACLMQLRKQRHHLCPRYGIQRAGGLVGQ